MKLYHKRQELDQTALLVDPDFWMILDILKIC